jgi:DNA-binding response OmpR family regulator
VKTVLIADDEANLRLLVAATIAVEDCEVIEAADGDQAWDLIVQRRPDVAILDVQMPGRTGLELTRAIRSDPLLAGTRVIILTSKARPSDIVAGTDVGADVYLTKPFLPVELLTAVEQAIAGVPS